jgi:hypothetical protein
MLACGLRPLVIDALRQGDRAVECRGPAATSLAVVRAPFGLMLVAHVKHPVADLHLQLLRVKSRHLGADDDMVVGFIQFKPRAAVAKLGHRVSNGATSNRSNS